MRYSAITSVLAAGLAIAHPVEQRDVAMDFNPPPGGDITILNYALTLEYLERKFYQEGLKKFNRDAFVAAGFADPFYDNLKIIASDEETHVSFLAGALADKAVHEATYSFPYTDVKSFLGLSSVLEGVGVSAYLGAAQAIVDKGYLTAAGSILTVESRHSSYIRSVLKQVPFPKAFDTPLDFNQVFSLAAQFITGFAPGDPALPFKAFPAIALQPSQYPYTAGSSPITFSGAYKKAIKSGLITEGQKVYAVLFSGLDTYYVETYQTRGNAGDLKIDRIPKGKNGQLPPTGQVYVVLSTADGVNKKVNDANTISGVGIVEVLPPRH
ncbi:hypothetical protein ONS95_002627 [Cadophora gregata]|uniref:uncharacterized protein n=1 Tax=Cadophora gregata TaxID=51156 RepID=UPI0026DC8312|nr:uncharacterized protein ONS95_002627 [Cadophora gregata]KAK0109960.1 hypothetical protein ONS95_002627 [Cadophora gregata]KAK0110413.1 hypothetical protein ONS96_002026 [Cadophora gregata f. sp. sojae]